MSYLDRRMIGTTVYNKYEFRQLGTEPQALYTYLLLGCDNDGVCDRVYDVMQLNRFTNNALLSLFNSQFVLPLDKDNRPDVIVWLPDFLNMNVIRNTKGYAPSRYRSMLRTRYPWAPVLIVKDNNYNIRTDIINSNDNIGVDPRTGIGYITPLDQLKEKITDQPAGYLEGDLEVTVEAPTHNRTELNSTELKKINDDNTKRIITTIIDFYDFFFVKKTRKTQKIKKVMMDALSVASEEELKKIVENESQRYRNGDYSEGFFPNITWLFGSGLNECLGRLSGGKSASKSAKSINNRFEYEHTYDFRQLEQEIIAN